MRRKKAIKASLWLISSKFLSIGLRFGFISIAARILEPEDFGLVNAAMIVISITDMISLVGVGAGLIYYKDSSDKVINTSVAFSFVLGLLFMGLTIACSDWLETFFGMEELSFILKILSVVFLFKAMSLINAALLERELKMKQIALSTLAGFGIGYCAVGISLALLDFGYYSLVFGIIAQHFISSTLLLIFSPLKFRFEFDFVQFRQVLSYGSGVSLSSILGWLNKKGDNFFVGRYLGASSLGLYSQSFNLMDAIQMFIGNTVNKVFFPYLRSKTDVKKESIQYFFLLSEYTIFLITPFVFVAYFFAPEIINILYSDGWEQMIALFQIFILTLPIRLVTKYAGVILQSNGKILALQLNQLIYFFIVLIYFLVFFDYNLNTVSLVVAAATIVRFVSSILMLFTNRIFSIQLFGTKLLLPFLIQGVLFYVMNLSEKHLITLVILFCIYFGLFYLKLKFDFKKLR